MSSMTYNSLCIPDDIAERGLEDVPNFHYRDDGLRLWDIINRYCRLFSSRIMILNYIVVEPFEEQAWFGALFFSAS